MNNKEILKNIILEVILEEGLFDRLNARTRGSLAGAKNAVKGKLDGLDAKVFGKHIDKYNALKNDTLAKNKYQHIKIQSYKNTANKKIEKLSTEIMNDLQKLGINTKGVSGKQLNFFKSSLNKALDDLIDQIPVGP